MSNPMKKSRQDKTSLMGGLVTTAFSGVRKGLKHIMLCLILLLNRYVVILYTVINAQFYII